MYKKFRKPVVFITLLFLPTLVYAAPGDLKELVELFVEIISQVSLLVAGLSMLVFFWGVALFILRSGDGSERERAKGIMLWGVIGLFVLVSFWGIIRVITNSFLG